MELWIYMHVFHCVWLWPQGLQATRLLCPWNFAGKNAGVGCHFPSRESSWHRDWTHVSCISGSGRYTEYMLVICYRLKESELLDGITLSKSEQWRKLPRFMWLRRCKKQAWAGFVGSSAGVTAKWAAFWKRSPPRLQGITMPYCPWKCHRWGTFFKLYQIKSLTSFPQKASSKASLWTPPSKSVRGDVGRIWSPYKIPSKMYEAAYKLHWIWLAMG